MAADPVRTVLEEGEIEIEGRMPWSSNGTFLAVVTHGDQWTRAIYKPRRGERPLWDFPRGLDRREVAAHELSEALGWGLVPHTVLRDGPLGIGSVQRFVEADFEQHYFTLYEAGRHHDRMRAMCAFDLVANNTDRKSGHCLVSVGDELFGIDHGLCFHEDFKLRTVIWEFAGEPVPSGLLDDLDRLRSCGVPPALAELLDDAEQEALLDRVDMVLDLGHFPVDGSGHRYPWPLV
ncbi:MAG: SCO1664 family protein [Acidimicrobiia bacterium]